MTHCAKHMELPEIVLTPISLIIIKEHLHWLPTSARIEYKILRFILNLQATKLFFATSATKRGGYQLTTSLDLVFGS